MNVTLKVAVGPALRSGRTNRSSRPEAICPFSVFPVPSSRMAVVAPALGAGIVTGNATTVWCRSRVPASTAISIVADCWPRKAARTMVSIMRISGLYRRTPDVFLLFSHGAYGYIMCGGPKPFGEAGMTLRLAILLSSLLAISAFAQDKPKPIPAHAKVDQEKVDDAIKKGSKYLIQSGQGMGSFPHGQRNQPQAMQAYGEIILLTLLHSGYYAEGDPELQPLIDFLNQKIIGSTYTAALMAMALQKLNPVKYQMRIAQCAQFLCDNQCQNGQWDYGEPGKDTPPMTYEIPKRKKADDVATGGGSV